MFFLPLVFTKDFDMVLTVRKLDQDMKRKLKNRFEN